MPSNKRGRRRFLKQGAALAGFHGPDFDAQLFGVCADLEINDDIAQLGLALPDGALYPERFGLRPHRLVEEYYLDWPRSETESFPSATPPVESCLDGPDGDPKTPPPWPTCGRGAHGVPMPWEDASDDDGVSVNTAFSSNFPWPSFSK